jgi:hypothetical protein
MNVLNWPRKNAKTLLTVASGGPALLKGDPTAPVNTTLSQQAIDANPTITKNEDGTLKTNAQVVTELYRRAGKQVQQKLDVVDQIMKDNKGDEALTGLIDIYKTMDPKSAAAATVKSLKSASFGQSFTFLCTRLPYLALCLPRKPRNLAAQRECPILTERSFV